jgi:hypothetical protein
MIVVKRYAVFVALGIPFRFLGSIDEAKDNPPAVAASLDARSVCPHPACESIRQVGLVCFGDRCFVVASTQYCELISVRLVKLRRCINQQIEVVASLMLWS